MRLRPPGWLRRRPVAGIAGSVLLHLLVLASLVLVGLPSSVHTTRRGEPLFVELPPADEPAQRGMPGAPAAAAPVARAERPTTPRAAPPRPVSPPPAAKAPVAPRAEKPAPRSAPTPQPPASKESVPQVASPPAPPEPLTKAPPGAPESVAPESAPSPPRGAPSAPPGGPVTDIRTALRRGGADSGPGGAGGGGAGRAGIEGEPIPLDSKDPKYNDYLDRVRRMIKEKWAFPCVRDTATGGCEYHTAQLQIEFGIAKDGRVPFVTLRRPSGFDIMDEYAMNAIKLASPFPPVPDTLSKKGIPILASFHYVVDTSLTNVLR
ncbi:MAG: hypothetical protein A3F92_02030 [Candidatus Rokubacteria bacterium RIFCSPLOWO2_12_FULL_71_22]|nr:MAG: hypothetical protein A3F92_02030 [Candidatus Rokubacteria bacterium RIFCSPLOWO2_12_FULL_71_22]